MTIWQFLDFGVNHERIAKYEQKAIEQQNTRIEILVRDINYHGINKLLKRNTYDIKDIKAVLKFFEEPPIKILTEKRIDLKLSNAFMSRSILKFFNLKRHKKR